jgi:4,5:9,10-diseco-3-hydroxy-5,9,17-trioxoandrosta-1(10),2-diene-4-oate hydrolase
MDASTDQGFEDQFAEVEGFKIRYLERGTGPAVIMLHGASLGSSADVFRRNIAAIGDGGLRAISLDMPGFGKSDYSDDASMGLKVKIVLGLMAALGIDKASIIGHSQAGNTAVRLGIDHPDRINSVVILGTGSLLPPLESGAGQREEAARERVDQRMARIEPGIEETRKLLEATVFHHDLITDDELALRHSLSIGQCFKAHVARTELSAAAKQKAKDAPAKPAGKAMWEQVADLTIPSLMVYGREDRARAADRAALLVEKRPGINLHMAEGCKHLVPWDAAAMVHDLAIPFMKENS